VNGNALQAEPEVAEQRVLGELARRVFRTDLTEPGFAHLVPENAPPTAADFRRLLVELGRRLGKRYQKDFGRPLHLFSLGSFDQQVATEMHRDGGPDESILILGYEPTTVASRLFVVDSTRAALEHGLATAEFLDRFNPHYPAGRQVLAPYVVEVEGFDPARYQIVVLNNSNRPWPERQTGMLGVLHWASIPRPDPSARRVVNSLILSPSLADGVPPERVLAFIENGETAVIG
jgi:hypothetical protein